MYTVYVQYEKSYRANNRIYINERKELEQPNEPHETKLENVFLPPVTEPINFLGFSRRVSNFRSIYPRVQ